MIESRIRYDVHRTVLYVIFKYLDLLGDTYNLNRKDNHLDLRIRFT